MFRTNWLPACQHARLEIIAGCAHVPQLGRPRCLLEAIGDFLPVS